MTITPFFFNTARVKAIYDYFGTDDVLSLRSNHISYSEFSLYGVFDCCGGNGTSPSVGEDGAWWDLPIDEASAVPNESLLTFHGSYSDETLANYSAIIHDDNRFHDILLVGWHKSIPANGTKVVVNNVEITNTTFFTAFSRNLAAIFTKAHLLTSPSETCDFYTNCCAGVVPCDDF